MPRIIDYTTLKAAVLAGLERENDAQAQELFDGWVSTAEGAFAPLLKAPWATRAAQFIWGDEGTVVKETMRYEYLPPSYNGMVTLLDLTNNRELPPISPPEIVHYRRGGSQVNRVHCIIGLTLFVIPDPGQPIELFLEYYSRQEPLTEANPVNSIITQAPNIYKYGVMAAAAVDYGETENYNNWSALMAQSLSDNNELDAGWRRGAGARVRVTR